MNYVPIDPPGTWCSFAAMHDLLRSLPGVRHRFVDVGCGSGAVSRLLLNMGMKGTALDYSPEALAICRKRLDAYVQRGDLSLRAEDILTITDLPTDHDLAVSFMVMEHVNDDANFVKQCARLVRAGGHVLMAVPGRKDKWTFEDQTVGHLRRYDRADLHRVFEAAGLQDIRVISVAVPIANVLLGVSDWLIKRSIKSSEIALSLEQQTKLSGIREIPWKTVFPRWVALLLNRYTLFPLLVMQRWFYNTELGVTVMGVGRVASSVNSPAH